MDGLRYSPDDPYYRLGPVHTCLYVRVRETGDWDLLMMIAFITFISSLEPLFPRSPGMGEGGDWWS